MVRPMFKNEAYNQIDNHMSLVNKMMTFHALVLLRDQNLGNFDTGGVKKKKATTKFFGFLGFLKV